MFLSKKTIEQSLRDTDAIKKNALCVKDMQEITEQYLEDINGGLEKYHYVERVRTYDPNKDESFIIDHGGCVLFPTTPKR